MILKLKTLLIYTLLIPIIGLFFLIITPSNEYQIIRLIAFNSSALTFICSLVLWLFSSNTYTLFQITYKSIWIPRYKLLFVVGIDGISLVFILLTTLLIALCILNSWKIENNHIKEFLACFLLLDFFLIGAFCAVDILFFYIFFESILIPMFFIIGVWGSRE